MYPYLTVGVAHSSSDENIKLHEAQETDLEQQVCDGNVCRIQPLLEDQTELKGKSWDLIFEILQVLF